MKNNSINIGDIVTICRKSSVNYGYEAKVIHICLYGDYIVQTLDSPQHKYFYRYEELKKEQNVRTRPTI